MKKAVTGGIYWTILLIIIGIAVIILFWLFLSGVTEQVPDIFANLVTSFKSMIKDLLGPWLGWIIG